MKRVVIAIIILCWTRGAGGATCTDVGYYCPKMGGYQRVEYIETTGVQYLDTGISLNSKYDMEMTWQVTRYVNDTWVSGWWSNLNRPMISLAGMKSNVLAASYIKSDKSGNIDPNEVSIPFDTNIHTTYCYKDKGIWIDDESSLKAADYDAEFPSNANFLVGCRNKSCWWGRVYSFIFTNEGQTMAEFIPVYDTQNEKYGMYDTVSNQFHGNVGSGEFIGGPFVDADYVRPCTNAPKAAHYTGSGTDNNCPWECDTGYVRTSFDTCATPCPTLGQLHIDAKSLNTYAVRQTNPSLVLRYKNEICYINAVPGRSTGTLNIKHGDDIFHLVN